MAIELFSNNASTTVSSGGTSAPSSGTTETWTVASSSSFPAASVSAAPPTLFHVVDPAATTEKIRVTNVSGTTWTVVRGAQSTTPVTHSSGFTVVNSVTASVLNGFGQVAQSLQFLTGGGAITTSTITAAQSAGCQGIFLDPRFVWDASGLVISDTSNFVIESRMQGSIGWTANISYDTGGYIKTDTGSPADGIQIYDSTPGSTQTQGVVFRNCVLVGSHSNAVIHFGGGQRRCGLIDTLVYNTSTATGSYGVQIDTALSDNNSENGIFSFTGGGGIAGGYGALGLGLHDQTQHCNDTLFDYLVTSGGTYSINAAVSSNVIFNLWYDRSSPSTANVLNSGGVLTFIGGEHLNNTGLAHQVTGGTTMLQNVLVSAGGATISSGALGFLGRCRLIGTVAMTGGTVAMGDPSGSWSSATITGSTGTLIIASFYSPGSAPTHSGFTGTLKTVQIT